MNQKHSIAVLADYLYEVNDRNYLRSQDADLVIQGMDELGILSEELPADGLIGRINGQINRLRFADEIRLTEHDQTPEYSPHPIRDQ